MSHLTDAAYDATAATRAACRAVLDRDHTCLDYALALHQLDATTSALTQLLTHLHRRVRTTDPHALPPAVAELVHGDLAHHLHAAETTARRLVTALNVCAADFDQIQAAAGPHRAAPAL